MKEQRRSALSSASKRRIFAPRNPGRHDDLLRRRVLDALRNSGRYSVVAKARIPVSKAAREAVGRARGGYIAAAFPIESDGGTVIVDLVVDEHNHWAGAFAFCRRGAQSPLARRRIGNDLRAAELLLRAHLSKILPVPVDTVTVGIIDGSANPEEADDITITPNEIADHFEIDFDSAESFGSFDGYPSRRIRPDGGRDDALDSSCLEKP